MAGIDRSDLHPKERIGEMDLSDVESPARTLSVGEPLEQLLPATDHLRVIMHDPKRLAKPLRPVVQLLDKAAEGRVQLIFAVRNQRSE